MSGNELDLRYLGQLLPDVSGGSEHVASLLEEPLPALLHNSGPCSGDDSARSRPGHGRRDVHTTGPSSDSLERQSSQLFSPEHQAREALRPKAILVRVA